MDVPYLVPGQEDQPGGQPGLRPPLLPDHIRPVQADPIQRVLGVGQVQGLRPFHPQGPGAAVQLRPIQGGGDLLRQAQGDQPVPDGLLLRRQGGGGRLRAGGNVAAQPEGGGNGNQGDQEHRQQEPAPGQPHRGGDDVIAPAGQGLSLPVQTDQQPDGQCQEGDDPPVVENGVEDLGADAPHPGGGDQLGPQGHPKGQQVAQEAQAQPVPAPRPVGAGVEGPAGPPPQGEEDEQVADPEDRGEPPLPQGVGHRPARYRGGGQHHPGHVEDQPQAGQDPGQPEPPAGAPQGPAAHITQSAAQQGQQVIQIEKVELNDHQSHAPQQTGHGVPPGVEPLRLPGVGGELGHLVHQGAVKFIGLHRSSPPSCAWSFLRMRYSRPSTARRLVPSSAAMRSVDWR